MSTDNYVYLHLYAAGGAWANVKVSEIEYKNMLKSLRAFDDPKHYWLMSVIGVLHNTNKYLWIEIITDPVDIQRLDEEHEEFNSR